MGASGDLAGEPGNTSLAAAATIIFLGSAASRLFGLVREQLAAGAFGAGSFAAAWG